mmetsp:Transcript_24694/g.48300  ORF Transcript_24694/g.48300 Transcript_24694/m.48300 type:complete len:150 (+) Transcript_24694:2-451(+)
MTVASSIHAELFLDVQDVHELEEHVREYPTGAPKGDGIDIVAVEICKKMSSLDVNLTVPPESQHLKGERSPLAADAQAYRKAAENGDAYSQYKLGACYESGRGVNKDMREAVLWYTKAAAQGNERAIHILRCLSRRLGVPKSTSDCVVS